MCPERAGCQGRAAAGMEESHPGHFTVKILVGKWEFSSCLHAASDLKSGPGLPGCSTGAGVQMRYDSARHSNMVTSCPAATGPGWVGRSCPSHRCISGGGGDGRAGPGSGTYVRAGTLCPVPGLGWHQSLSHWDRPMSPTGVALDGAWVPPVPPWQSFGDPCPEPGEPGEPLQLPPVGAPALVHPAHGHLPSSVPSSSTSPL